MPKIFINYTLLFLYLIKIIKQISSKTLIIAPLIIVISIIASSTDVYADLGYDPGLLTEEDHDPSFELDEANAKWTWSTSGTPDYEYTGENHTGDESFTWANVAGTFPSRELELDNYITGLSADKSYAVSVYWMAPGTHWAHQRLQLEILWYEDDDTYIDTSTSGEISLSAQEAWEEKEFVAQAPPKTAKAIIKISARHVDSSSRQVFDTVSFHEVPEEASEVTLTGETDIRADDTTTTETYTAELDASIENIPVNFSLSDFLEDDIDSVSEGDKADLVGAGIEVNTDENGVAELDITFAAGIDKSGDLTASIDDEHESVSVSDSDTITLNVNTTEIPKYEITFNVQDEGTLSVEGATVTLVGIDNKITGVDGLAVFTDVPEGTYDYTVEKEGFQTVEDSVVVDDDKTEHVTLYEVEPNLLLNWHFEEWDDPYNSAALLHNWDYTGTDSRVLRDSENNLVGDYSARVNQTTTGEENLNQFDHTLEVGETYYAEAWVKGTGDVRVGIVRGGGGLATYGSVVTLDDDDWTRVTHERLNDTEGSSGGIRIAAVRPNGNSVIYVGAAWLGPEPPPTDWPTFAPSWVVIDSFENDAHHDSQPYAPDAQWWTLDDDVYHNFYVTDEESFNGSYSLKVEYDKTEGEWATFRAGDLYDSNNVSDFSVSKSSSISIWVYPEGEPLEILMTFEDADNNESGDIGSKTAETPDEWQELKFTWDEGKLDGVDITRIDQIYLFFAPGDGTASGTVYLDDLKLNDVGSDVRNVLAKASETEHKIDLYWPAAGSVEGKMDEYHIYRSQSDFTSPQEEDLVYSTTSLSWTDTDVEPETEYFYSIIAEDTQERTSPMTVNVSTTTPELIIVNLLDNPSFEDGVGQDGPLGDADIDDWVHWGPGWWAGDDPYDGDWEIKRFDGGTGMYQDFDAQSGTSYKLSLRARDDSAEPLKGNSRLELKLEWFDDQDDQIGNTILIDSLLAGGELDTWIELVGLRTAPENTHYGRFLITTEGSFEEQAVYYDMALVTETEESAVNILPYEVTEDEEFDQTFTLTLVNEAFDAGLDPSDILLGGDFDGLSIDSVSRENETEAEVRLTDNLSFETGIGTVTVLASGLAGDDPLTASVRVIEYFENLLLNPSFEDLDEGDPIFEHWVDEGPGVVYESWAESRTGDKSMTFWEESYGEAWQDYEEAEVGSNYIFSIYGWPSHDWSWGDVEELEMYIKFLDEFDAVLSSSTLSIGEEDFMEAETWSQFYVEGIAPSETDIVRVGMKYEYTNADGIFNWDDAELIAHELPEDITLTGTAISTNTINWDWSSVPEADEYRIFDSEDNGELVMFGSEVTDWTEEDLDVNTLYSRYVMAYEDGTPLSKSNIESAYTYAAPPFDLVFEEVNISSVTISWSTSTANPEGTRFGVKVSSADWFSDPGSAFPDLEISFEDGLTASNTYFTELDPETTYYFTVYAFNDEGQWPELEEYAVSGSTTTLPPPVGGEIFPELAVYNLQAPGDVTTTIILNDAETVESVSDDVGDLTKDTEYGLIGEDLIIFESYLSGKLSEKGESIEIYIDFDIGTATFTVKAGDNNFLFNEFFEEWNEIPIEWVSDRPGDYSESAELLVGETSLNIAHSIVSNSDITQEFFYKEGDGKVVKYYGEMWVKGEGFLQLGIRRPGYSWTGAYSAWQEISTEEWKKITFELESDTREGIEGEFRIRTTRRVDELGEFDNIDLHIGAAWLGTTVSPPEWPVALETIDPLSAEDLEDGDVKLTWTAPEEISDGYYRIRWSTFPGVDWISDWDETEEVWDYDRDNRYSVTFSTSTGEDIAHSYLVDDLAGGVTYYFKIWTGDDKGFWSEGSDTAGAEVQKITSVTITAEEHYFGQLDLGQSTMTVEAITVKNTGNVPVTYSIKGSTLTEGTPWFFAGEQGWDEFVLKGAFHNEKPSKEAFDTYSNIILSEYRDCSVTDYTIDGSQAGVNIPKGGELKLWLNFRMPVQTTTPEEQEMSVTIGAKEHEE